MSETCAALLRLCVELIHSISFYLDSEDVGSLLAVNKFFSSACFSEDNYWWLRFYTLVAPIQLQCSRQSLFHREEYAKKMIANILTSLQAPNYLSLYQCLHRFDFPLLGLWCREPRDLAADFRGGLLRLRVVPAGEGTREGSSSVQAESLSPHGAVVSPCFSVHFTATCVGSKKRRGKSFSHLTAVNNFDKSVYMLRRGGEGCLLFRAAAAEGTSSPPTIRLLSLTHDQPSFSSSPYHRSSSLRVVSPTIASSTCADSFTGAVENASCAGPRSLSYNGAVTLGLYMANFGPHGYETLVMHAAYRAHALSASERSKSIRKSNRRKIKKGGVWTLTGLKVLGDANVPAQKASFQVFIDSSCAPPLLEDDGASSTDDEYDKDADDEENDVGEQHEKAGERVPLDSLVMFPPSCSQQQISSVEMQALREGVFVNFTEDGQYEFVRFSDDEPAAPPLILPVTPPRPLRSIRAVLTGRGQINRQAGHWAPEWMPASLVVYHPQQSWQQQGAAKVVFSVIFKYKKEHGHVDGHIMDYFSVETPFLYLWEDGTGGGGGNGQTENSVTTFIDNIWREKA